MAQLRYVFQVLVSVQPVSQASPNSGTVSLGADQSSFLLWSFRTILWFNVPVSSSILLVIMFASKTESSQRQRDCMLHASSDYQENELL